MHALVEGRSRLAHLIAALVKGPHLLGHAFGVAQDLLDGGADVADRALCLVREVLDLVCDHREALAGLARARCLDGRIEGE